MCCSVIMDIRWSCMVVFETEAVKCILNCMSLHYLFLSIPWISERIPKSNGKIQDCLQTHRDMGQMQTKNSISDGATILLTGYSLMYFNWVVQTWHRKVTMTLSFKMSLFVCSQGDPTLHLLLDLVHNFTRELMVQLLKSNGNTE